MYLSKIDMDRSCRSIRSAMVDCQKMHRLLMGLFDMPRQKAQVLYRIKEQGMRIAVYLYSAVPVIEERLVPGMTLAGQRNVSSWLDSMKNGRFQRFDLLVMPSKKVPGAGKNSQRRVLRTQEERTAWLRRKAEQSGFEICAMVEQGNTSFYGEHPNADGVMRWDSYHYTGILRIMDQTAFQHAVENGIGPGKAYGMGMLLLA